MQDRGWTSVKLTVPVVDKYMPDKFSLSPAEMRGPTSLIGDSWDGLLIAS